MQQKLMQLVEEFGRELSKYKYDNYIPKLRDYFLGYINDNKASITNIEHLLKFEFTRNDIILSTEYYVVNNGNVRSKSAIDDFLIALNRFFVDTVFKYYPNQNLITIRPFTNLSKEIENDLLEKGVELDDRQAYPPIKEEHYKFIMRYINIDKDKSLKTKQVHIIIKLLLLFGLSFDRIINLKKSDYCSEKRTLEILYKQKPARSFILELPYKLNKEIENYITHLNENKFESEYLFVNRNGKKINHGFPNWYLTNIKNEYYKNNDEIEDVAKSHPFTPTGLAKYAVINMIIDGFNQSVITDLTGFKHDSYSDCQDIVNEIKLLDRNRYINHMIRGVSTFDEVK